MARAKTFPSLPSPQPALRPLRAEDLDAVRRLCSELGYSVTAEELQARFKQVRDSPNNAAWVALDPSGRVAGLLHVYGRLALEAPPQATVQALVVGGAGRLHGIGRRLMAAAEAWALERGFAFVGLSTNVRRRGAPRFYEALGYVLLGRSRIYRRALH